MKRPLLRVLIGLGISTDPDFDRFIENGDSLMHSNITAQEAP